MEHMDVNHSCPLIRRTVRTANSAPVTMILPRPQLRKEGMYTHNTFLVDQAKPGSFFDDDYQRACSLGHLLVLSSSSSYLLSRHRGCLVLDKIFLTPAFPFPSAETGAAKCIGPCF